MSRKWVLNTSPLVTLGKVSGISLLERTCSDLIVPEGVVRELDQWSAADPARIWIHGDGGNFPGPHRAAKHCAFSFQSGLKNVRPGGISLQRSSSLDYFFKIEMV